MSHAKARPTRRVWLPAFFFGAFALVICARLIQLQVIQHDAYAERAKAELSGSQVIYARRGAILDRNGAVLANSVGTWDIYVSSRSWRDNTDAMEASTELGKLLKIDPAALRSQVASTDLVDVPIRKDVNYEVGLEIIGKGLPGVITIANTAREHPEGDVAASVLGFIGTDNTGLAGIEAAYNDVLQGIPGRAVYERDTSGEPIPYGRYVATEPRPGEDLVLTIDRYLQQMAEERLAAAIKEHRAAGGSIIIMDPATGEILAMATSPGLKFSSLDLGSDQVLELLRNRAVTDLYEPGSVMKIITAAAAIDGGAVTPGTTYTDNGVALIYDVPIKNWDDNVYGEQTMTGVLQHSINTGAIFMMQALEAKQPGAFQAYLDAFGFGKPTGIDLQGEAEGIIRRTTDDDYSPVDLATQAFGQSISVTPIQLLTAIAAAINGGNVMRPHLVKAYIGPDGVRRDVRPEVVGRAVSSETSSTIRDMLNKVVDPEGNIHPGNPKFYTAGGKSGTANVPVPNGYDETQIASFVGFAPLADPEILVLVKLDENQDGLTGTAAAAPVFASLADDALRYLNVRPEKGAYVSQR
ncbi:MAG TPA: penicillin-binding protein 2 [Tepidiformaceae bacterium]|nr:penicillin-binding protein 2 [Tepidiformaceae bacterium]